MDSTDQRLHLADPQRAIDLLGTLRQDGEDLVDLLETPRGTCGWMQEHFGDQFGEHQWTPADHAELVQLRDHMRALITAVVDGQVTPSPSVATINAAAAPSPT